MAQQKCRKSRRSSGNKAVINKAKEERRQIKFADKREEGRTYKYKPIPYAKGTIEYQREKMERAAKIVSKKTPVAIFTSIMKKLENQLEKEKTERKSRKERSNNRVAF